MHFTYRHSEPASDLEKLPFLCTAGSLMRRSAPRFGMPTFLLASLLAFSATAYPEQHPCNSTEAQRADAEVDRLHSWDALYKWYRAYRHCDDGGIAEGVSEAVARNLVDRWETLPQFAKLATTTPGFRRFVIQHVDETLDLNDLKKIHANAAKRCPAGLRAFCDDLKKTAGPS